MDALTEIASDPPTGPWDWDAIRYMIPKERPKWMRALTPDLTVLNNHSQVLLVLIRLTPKGRPNLDSLRDLLIRLHTVFRIFPKDRPTRSAKLSLTNRTVKAADRWLAMCLHCLLLVKRKAEIPGCFEGLKEVLAAIQVPGSKPMAATASVTGSLPFFDDNILQLSMALTDHVPSPDTPILM